MCRTLTIATRGILTCSPRTKATRGLSCCNKTNIIEDLLVNKNNSNNRYDPTPLIKYEKNIFLQQLREEEEIMIIIKSFLKCQ